MKYCTPTCLCYVYAVLCFLKPFFSRNDKLSLLKLCSSLAKMFLKNSPCVRSKPEFSNENCDKLSKSTVHSKECALLSIGCNVTLFNSTYLSYQYCIKRKQTLKTATAALKCTQKMYVDKCQLSYPRSPC